MIDDTEPLTVPQNIGTAVVLLFYERIDIMKNRFAAIFLIIGIVAGVSVVSADNIGSAAIIVSAADESLSAPKNISFSQTSDSVTLEWNSVKGASGYKIYRYDENSKKYKSAYTSKTTSYKITGLKSNRTYSFKIAAVSKINGKTVTGKMSSSIKVTTAPVFPDITKYGFEIMPDFDSDSGQELTEIVNSNPGMMVGLVPIDPQKTPSDQTEYSVGLFKKYCDALKKKGFTVEIEGNTVAPAENGFAYTYSYFVKYNNNTVGKVLFIMGMERSGANNDEMVCTVYCIIVVPVSE